MDSILKILITQRNSRQFSHYLKNELTHDNHRRITGIGYTRSSSTNNGKEGQLPSFITLILSAALKHTRGELWIKVCESSEQGRGDHGWNH